MMYSSRRGVHEILLELLVWRSLKVRVWTNALGAELEHVQTGYHRWQFRFYDRYASHVTPNTIINGLVKKSDDFSGNVFSPGLFMIHNAGRGSEDYVTKLAGWQELYDPLLEFCEADIVPRRDNSSLIQANPMSAEIRTVKGRLYIPAV
jgi:hypothetical protein